MKTLNELLWDNEKTLDDWLDEIDKENPKPFSSGPSITWSCSADGGGPKVDTNNPNPKFYGANC